MDFGLHIYVILQEIDREAIAATKYLISKVNEEKSTEIKERALDAKSIGVVRRSTIHNISDNGGFVEDNLCTGIGGTRWGCEAVIIGNLDQILQKKQRLYSNGFRGLIFSDFSNLAEYNLFAKYVLPKIRTVSMPILQNRKPHNEPLTTLAGGIRK